MKKTNKTKQNTYPSTLWKNETKQKKLNTVVVFRLLQSGEAKGFPVSSFLALPSSVELGILQAAGRCGAGRQRGASRRFVFCKRGYAAAGPLLFVTTFLMRLTTHDKLSYMETKSRFNGISVPQRYIPEVAAQTK